MKTEHIKVYPGDVVEINGGHFTVSNTVMLISEDSTMHRIPMSGMTDLPETDIRIKDVFPVREFPRKHMTLHQNYRCPCGSAYTRQSETHLSCNQCGRVWENRHIPKAI